MPPRSSKTQRARSKKNRGLRLRAFVIQMKDGPCTDCGNKFPIECMDFDHIKNKSFTIAKQRFIGIERMKNEIYKCELVCSNCHRIRTSSRRKNSSKTLLTNKVNIDSSDPVYKNPPNYTLSNSYHV